MPGPMSSPNGKLSTTAPRDMSKHRYESGKTALKRGELKHAKNEAQVRKVAKLSRARREEQEEN